jgi:hypothetical protein
LNPLIGIKKDIKQYFMIKTMIKLKQYTSDIEVEAHILTIKMMKRKKIGLPGIKLMEHLMTHLHLQVYHIIFYEIKKHLHNQ